VAKPIDSVLFLLHEFPVIARSIFSDAEFRNVLEFGICFLDFCPVHPPAVIKVNLALD
jgi:hypothetical protein